MLNTIFKAFAGKRNSLVAIVSYDYRIGKYIMSYKIKDYIVGKMGFASYKQYISSYPGNFELNSITRKNSKVKHYDTLINCPSSIDNKRQMKSALKSENRVSNLIIVPTIAEVRKSYGFSRISPNGYDLWFCSDWDWLGE